MDFHIQKKKKKKKKRNVPSLYSRTQVRKDSKAYEGQKISFLFQINVKYW